MSVHNVQNLLLLTHNLGRVLARNSPISGVRADFWARYGRRSSLLSLDEPYSSDFLASRLMNFRISMCLAVSISISLTNNCQRDSCLSPFR